MKTISIYASAIIILIAGSLSSCKKDTVQANLQPTQFTRQWQSYDLAYFDSTIVDAQLNELDSSAEGAAIAASNQFNIFYDFGSQGPESLPYLKVLAVAPGTTGLWRKVSVVFKEAKDQKQYYSAAEIAAAAQAKSPRITLVTTNEIYNLITQ